MSYVFKKRFINENEDYRIEYWPDNVFQKIVDDTKPLYIEWINEGNIPEEIPFIPSPPPSIEQKRTDVQYMAIEKQNNDFDGGFVFENNTYPSKTHYREVMVTGARLGQQAIDDNVSLNLSAFTISGTIESLNEHQMVEMLTIYDNYGADIYNLFMEEMTILPTASENELDYYLENNRFE